MVNLSDLPNPFDFAKPVLTKSRFVGRAEELADARYYLKQATQSAQAINLALIGRRAAGKTSFLNILEADAVELGFAVVRLDLDEGDTRSDLVFFAKMLEGLITVACRRGAFEGITGKVFGVYRDVMDTFQIPEDKTFCPFEFPLQYARAASIGNLDAPVSDAAIRHDLETLQGEIDCPVLLIIDEADLMGHHRGLLQKFRNTFMNSQWYMIALAGTPDLFPVINDVFSPISRQFKTISIGPFESQDETSECLRKPLTDLGLDPDVYIDEETLSDMADFHRFAEGRPYEIQLIGHHMFRHMQSGRSSVMRLSVDIIDDVLGEIDKAAALQNRPFVAAIRNASEPTLHALATVACCDGRATAEQAWFSVHVLGNQEPVDESQAEFLDEILRFRSTGLVRERADGALELVADELDKLYLKYTVRRRCRHFWFAPTHGVSPEHQIYVSESLFALFRGPWSAEIRPGDPELRTVRATLDALATPEEPLGDEQCAVLQLLYFHGLTRPTEPIQSIEIEVVTPWTEVLNAHFVQVRDNPHQAGFGERAVSWEEAIESRVTWARLMGGDLRCRTVPLGDVVLDTIFGALEKPEAAAVREEIARSHANYIFHLYLHGDMAEVTREVTWATRLAGQENETSTLLINNAAYIRMATQDYEGAIALLRPGAEQGTLPTLSIYNLAICEYATGCLVDACDRLVGLLDRIGELRRGSAERPSGVFFVVTSVGDVPIVEERRGIDLADAAQESLAHIETEIAGADADE